MIKGIENLNPKLQKAILGCICSYFDLSEDIEVENLEEDVYQILDTKFYVITDDDIQRKIASYNSEHFADFFDNLSPDQMKYVDRDLWYEQEGISTFEDWINECTDWIVNDTDYYGNYNFYEIH